MNAAVLETYSSRKLTNLEQKIHKQITQTQKEFDATRIKDEKKLEALKNNLIELQKAQIKIRQKQIMQMEQELEPTKKCLESLTSETAIITPSNEPTDILKAMEQASRNNL